MAEKRTRDIFYQKKFSKSHSSNTIQNCKTALKNLDNFCLAKYGKTSADQVIGDLKKMPMTSTYNFLQNFINWKSGSCKASALRQYFTIISEYMFYHGLKMYPQDIKHEITLPKNDEDTKPPLELDVVKKILDFFSTNRKALYMTLIGSGLRVGEAVGLRKRDFDTRKKQKAIRSLAYHSLCQFTFG